MVFDESLDEEVLPPFDGYLGFRVDEARAKEISNAKDTGSKDAERALRFMGWWDRKLQEKDDQGEQIPDVINDTVAMAGAEIKMNKDTQLYKRDELPYELTALVSEASLSTFVPEEVIRNDAKVFWAMIYDKAVRDSEKYNREW